MSQAEAYRQAVAASDDILDKTVWENASKLAAKVRPRVQELLRAIHGEVATNLVYRWEEAMAELTALHRKAFMAGDLSVVATAIRQKSKISGLEVDPRQNGMKPFDGATDEELDAEIHKAEAEIKRYAAVRH